MFPVILLVHWLAALHLMAAGDWCAHTAGSWFACTPAAPRPGPVVFSVPFRQMASLIRHGYECTRGGGRWLCTPDQIPR